MHTIDKFLICGITFVNGGLLGLYVGNSSTSVLIGMVAGAAVAFGYIRTQTKG